MDVKKLTQSDVADLLKNRVGIVLKSATISRYNKSGLILMPKRFPNYFNGVSRIYYHPSVPVELATAYLLFRGDWLKLDSSYRISRFSTQDVYLGRLLFYLDQFRSEGPADIPIDFVDFLTSSHLFPTDYEGTEHHFLMDKENLHAYLSSYAAKYLKPFAFFKIDEEYQRYIVNMYRITYLWLFKTIYNMPPYASIDETTISTDPKSAY